MILHKLIFRYLKHKDDEGFYLIQAQYTIKWFEKVGVKLGSGTRVLDLGCGHGIFGAELAKKGCQVTFADVENTLIADLRPVDFRKIDIMKDDLVDLGEYDLVICANIIEHLSDPQVLVDEVQRLLAPGGKLYLCWVNWLSPWGGHDFSPFHYLGPHRGHLAYDRLTGRRRVHTPYVTLFPTSISGILKMFRRNKELRILKVVPRYYPEFSFIVRVPVLREFLTWNCALLVERCA